MTPTENTSHIVKRLSEKSSVKYQVYDNTLAAFRQMMKTASQIVSYTRENLQNNPKIIPVEFSQRSDFEFEMKFATDLILVSMHTNVFEFPRDHELQKTSYVKENPMRSYCGIIHIYDFLADSFKYNRHNDSGYLVARVFINYENHFFVEGKRQIGMVYNDFINKTLTEESIKNILEAAIMYCIDFDLLTPPYDAVKEASVGEAMMNTATMSMKTAKRLGFRFQADHDKEH
jgi:hypothetical protein